MTKLESENPTSIHLRVTSQLLNSHARRTAERLLELAQSSCEASSSIKLVDSPANADLILFMGSLSTVQTDVKQDDVFAAFKSKSLVLDQSDHTIPTLPGLYTNVPRWLQRFNAIGQISYLRVFDNPYCPDDAPFHEADLLFSFVGNAANYPRVRKQVCRLVDARAVLIDSNNPLPSPDAQFGAILTRSKFILCPRGKCPSTFRLYEAMRAGRVPVIISDDWEPFGGIDWDAFSIRIDESQVKRIPTILRTRESEAESMGAIARKSYEQNFSRESLGRFIVNQARELLGSQSLPRRFDLWKGMTVQVRDRLRGRIATEILRRQLRTIVEI